MTNLVDRPSSPRGERRRQQLVAAGIELLGEGGWPAVTTRAVAERGGANQGLIHYHFGGLPGLREAIARRAGELVIEPVVDAVLAAGSPAAALDVLREVVPAVTADDRVVRLSVELIAGAARDPALAELFRAGLRQARARVADHLEQLYPDLPERDRDGAAVLLAALVDGLVLHALLDPDLPVGIALDTLGRLGASGGGE
ncbi:TetR/AcrR family transcriptional regulator [Prauserella cavernicola]|uniref:TetR family transcriptional regulator C-terminal domain-containing protein n=1 Tax=Prauserella cavernicola TaxID=2800127 RepID=A0A934V7R4_9PSEU|nr:TetR family transcriptional regulator C-terminal domain-containing protein [Prauserella cavernicola]MBK1787003.1 TetR family transcriptional regulator C-terminal domain-containing protein [Prauserella cavernicola]